MMKHLILPLLLLLLSPANAGAQEAVRLGIDPTIIKIEANTPSNVQAPFVLKNLSSRTINLTYEIIPFEAKENGQIKLLTDKKDNLSPILTERLSIIDERSSLENIELRPGENKKLSIFIELNESDSSNDHYFSLVFINEGETVENASLSSINTGIATNIILSVNPNDEKEARIIEFNSPSFITSGPVPFSVKVDNTGENAIQAQGHISIKNLLGKEVGRINILPQNILRNSSRYLVDESQSTPSAEVKSHLKDLNSENPVSIWGEEFLFGPYTATLSIKAGKGGEIKEKTTRFTAFPFKTIIVVSGVIAVALGIIFQARKRIKTRKDK